MKEYQILVISSENEFIYVGDKKDKQIILFNHNNHFDYVRSLPSFFNDNKFCFNCLTSYHDDLSHECIKLCRVCRQKFCKKEKSIQFKCSTCKINCSSNDCLMYHQENVCKSFTKCLTCGRIKTRNHTCLGRWCLNCSTSVEMNHKCYILTEDERNKSTCLKRKSEQDPNDDKNENKTEGFIFFDFESMNVDGLHVPNLIIADKLCFLCINNWNIKDNSRKCSSDCGIKSFKITMTSVIGFSSKRIIQASLII